MRKQLDEKLARFEELERSLHDPEVLANPSRMSAILREHGSLAKLATRYRRFRQISRQILEARELAEESSDPELRELAESELEELRREREELWDDLLALTVGGEDAERTRCIMEIRAGTGGEEAALFARDLFEMYRRYAELKGWKLEILELNPTELGGFKEVSFGLEGEEVFRRMQYESGGHRVQRVPETEAKGRIHTSLATVAVLREPDDVEIELKPEDYRRDTFHASGPGGQHVNKTSSAIRLTHYETGIVVQCQDEKSQHKNLAKALRVLKSRIYEHYQRAKDEQRAEERRTLIGSGDRSQKIRTYNFPENRVTDHRINLTLYQLSNILAGNLDPLIEAILDHERAELRSTFGQLD
ncbi:MAG: peptide chain release factor 1 [Thermogutta sp.]|nr:peptide chain release factor 1 [Thermogutta sp.]